MTPRLDNLRRRWPADDAIQILNAYPALTPGFLRLEAIADCGGGLRRFHADVPVALLIDEDTMLEAARAGLRAARNAVMAMIQAQVLEA